MAGMPTEPDAFAEHVLRLLKRREPEAAVELVSPSELLINGRRLDLNNLLRMVNHDPDRGGEIVEYYLEQLFASEATRLASVSYEFARPRIMPRIQPESIFEHLGREMVAHVPFVNGTVIVFVIDLPQMTISATTDQMVRWGVTADDLEQLARENLDRYAPDLELQVVESREGGKAAILSAQDGYDAARLLLSDLYHRLAPQLGGDFYVATPARDMFVAMSVAPKPFVSRLRDRVDHDYKRLPYPICSDLFYVTRDGVAGTEQEREAA
jgi:uncharacterized protein YtpQ (UPF0354 family)